MYGRMSLVLKPSTPKSATSDRKIAASFFYTIDAATLAAAPRKSRALFIPLPGVTKYNDMLEPSSR